MDVTYVSVHVFAINLLLMLLPPRQLQPLLSFIQPLMNAPSLVLSDCMEQGAFMGISLGTTPARFAGALTGALVGMLVTIPQGVSGPQAYGHSFILQFTCHYITTTTTTTTTATTPLCKYAVGALDEQVRHLTRPQRTARLAHEPLLSSERDTR